MGAGLRLGTLAYSGSPTAGSVIVYSSTNQSWGRVPIPEVAAPRQGEEWLRFFKRSSSARWMMGGLVVAVLCVGLGLYGMMSSRHADMRVTQPLTQGV